MTHQHSGLSWRLLAESDRPALAALATQCLAADGGQPFADSEGFLGQSYPAGGGTLAAVDGARLVCVSSVRRMSGPQDHAASAGTGDAGQAVTTGLVHPHWRRRGLGRRAFGWARHQAGSARLRAESEALSAGAHALYVSEGLSQIFAEDVMQLPGSAARPAVSAPAGMALAEWDAATSGRFFAVYEASFRERPGFPGWPRERWIEWISDDADFRPAWTLLATLDGSDAGFIAAEATGWIAQVGVLPAARGRGVGASLIAEVVQRMRTAGETAITLNVNVNNPHAAGLYRRLGFAVIGRRARYERVTG